MPFWQVRVECTVTITTFRRGVIRECPSVFSGRCALSPGISAVKCRGLSWSTLSPRAMSSRGCFDTVLNDRTHFSALLLALLARAAVQALSNSALAKKVAASAEAYHDAMLAYATGDGPVAAAAAAAASKS